MEKTDFKKMLKELYQPTHKDFSVVDGAKFQICHD